MYTLTAKYLKKNMCIQRFFNYLSFCLDVSNKTTTLKTPTSPYPPPSLPVNFREYAIDPIFINNKVGGGSP